MLPCSAEHTRQADYEAAASFAAPSVSRARLALIGLRAVNDL